MMRARGSPRPKHMRSQLKNRRQSGFSLVEMIGVLAIIAILAVIIVPKVFSTIASSRITNAVGSANSMKASVSEFVTRYGTVPISGAGAARFDDLLVTTGILEQRFLTKLGTQPGSTLPAAAVWSRNATTGAWAATGGTSHATQSRLISMTSTAAAPGAGTNYQLDGTNNLPTGSRVVSVVIPGLTAAEARELSVRIDGDVGSQINTGTADTAGKVVYTAPATGTYTAYIYLAHQ
jgi:prepilin-type N-terminal cleavage/methylation domain-containing protein